MKSKSIVLTGILINQVKGNVFVWRKMVLQLSLGVISWHWSFREKIKPTSLPLYPPPLLLCLCLPVSPYFLPGDERGEENRRNKILEQVFFFLPCFRCLGPPVNIRQQVMRADIFALCPILRGKTNFHP